MASATKPSAPRTTSNTDGPAEPIGYDTAFDDVGPLTGLSAALTYHDFDAARVANPLGAEADVEVSASFGPQWTAGVKFADFDGEGPDADRRKLWLSLEFRR